MRKEVRWLVALACIVGSSSATAQAERRAAPTGVPHAPPLVRFEAEATSGRVPFRVMFYDRSIAREPRAWAWDFGDGSTSSERHPRHTYGMPGLYTVSLTVTGQDGSRTLTRRDYIVVLDPKATDYLPPGFVDELVFQTQEQATGFLVLDEDDLVIWTKAGRVLRWRAGSFLGSPLLDIREEVSDWNDHGLLGFALDPHYAENGFVYAYYVVDRHHLDHFGTPAYDPLADDFERETVARITRYAVFDPADPATTVDPLSRTVLVGEDRFTGIPICSTSHGIGSLFFGADESLLFTTGDGFLGSPFQAECLTQGFYRPKDDVGAARAQLVDGPNGKIHRVDPATGDGLPTNPFFDPLAPRSWASRVWTLGLRQPYRASVRPPHGEPSPAHEDHPGTIYLGEVGHLRWEELNVVTDPAQNLGWPKYEGPEVTIFDTHQENLDAPNPLFGQAGCPREFFDFVDLLVEDTLNTPFWPNPCDPAQEVPASIPRFVHTRPAITWGHLDAIPGGVALVKGYDASGNAIAWPIDDPSSPVSGESFSGSAAIGGTWYTGTTFPAPFQDVYFCADFVEGWIKAFQFDVNDRLEAVHEFASDRGPIVHLATDPAGEALYYLKFFGPATLRRISFGANAGPTADADALPRFGAPPLLVQLAADDSIDPEGAPLAFSWDFGDGEPWSPLHTRMNTGHVFGSEDVTDQAQPIRPAFVQPRLRSARPLQEPPVAGADVPLVHDGSYPEPGAQDTRSQELVEDHRAWFGYLLPAERDVVAMILQEGLNFGPQGGFFGKLGVESWNDTIERWQPVSGLVINPPYASSSSTSYETFHLSFDPVSTTAVRVRDLERAQGPGRFTLGELRLLAARDPLPTGPLNRTATVTVTDPFGESSAAAIPISLNNTPPEVTIRSPRDGETYPVGQSSVVALVGEMEDDEHAVGTLQCEWTIELVHDSHIHPEPPDVSCVSAFTILPHGELEGDVIYWRVRLTVTDPLGLATSVTHRLVPEGDCNLNGIYDGLDIINGTSSDANGNGVPDECE